MAENGGKYEMVAAKEAFLHYEDAMHYNPETISGKY